MEDRGYHLCQVCSPHHRGPSPNYFYHHGSYCRHAMPCHAIVPWLPSQALEELVGVGEVVVSRELNTATARWDN